VPTGLRAEVRGRGYRKANRISVKNVRLRVLALGGNDRIVANSGKDTCVDGGAGNNTIIDQSKTMAFLYGGGASNNRISIGNGKAYASGVTAKTSSPPETATATTRSSPVAATRQSPPAKASTT
jgi:Ca2+-binding RTX toxin-like protein